MIKNKKIKIANLPPPNKIEDYEKIRKESIEWRDMVDALTSRLEIKILFQ